MVQTKVKQRVRAAIEAVEEAAWESATYPLGCHFIGDEVTFAVYSGPATRVLLELYDQATGADPVQEFELAQNPADKIWRAKLANLREGTFYAFRCWGPNWPFDSLWRRGGSGAGFVTDVDEAGNRFNPNKVLFDPYARELSHDKTTPAMLEAGHDGSMYGTGGEMYHDLERRVFDTGHWAPKGIILRQEKYKGRRPRHPAEHAVIYETHVRGLTQHPSSSELEQIFRGVPELKDIPIKSVPAELRGTYAGAACMAPYFKALGITTVEFMPVHETDNDANDVLGPRGANYWGYMTFGYFAPDRRYAHDKSPGGPTREFKAMTEAFHAEGIEVYLDVVYNHHGEGGNWGKLDTTGFVSLGGFDAAEYYAQTDEHYLIDGATGCGNQLNYSSHAAQKLVLDSLQYWVEVMGVDGFRFDLAPVLGRAPEKAEAEDWDQQKRFFNKHPLLVQIRDLAQRDDVEVVAEAWDMWGYEVGNFPKNWGEWNGRFRDSVRDFIRAQGDSHRLINLLNGDYEHFHDQGGPQRSINFVVAHDGFTLADIVSYTQKTNTWLEWPFGPSDGGSDDNRSYDWGGNHAVRRKHLRNFWTLLFFARGVPMVGGGDEFGRTQNGNNNSYAIDSVASWNNYYMLGTNRPQGVPTGDGGAYHDNLGAAEGPAQRNPLFLFARFVAKLRNHSHTLRQRNYGDFAMDSGKDVTYEFRGADGVSPVAAHDRCIWLRIDGSEVGEADLLLLMNMHYEGVNFVVPPTDAGRRWVRRIDTAEWAEPQNNFWPLETATEIRDLYLVQPSSIVMLQLVKPEETKAAASPRNLTTTRSRESGGQA
jgi:glycogen operon protein